MGNVAQVTAKVQQYLSNSFNGVTLDRNGGFSLRHESARAFVQVSTRDAEAPTIIHITVPVLFGVNAGPALYEYVAFHADDYVFGHLSLGRQEDNSVNLFMTHTLLGDYLDSAELEVAVAGTLSTANDLDDELQTRFGGQRFHES